MEKKQSNKNNEANINKVLKYQETELDNIKSIDRDKLEETICNTEKLLKNMGYSVNIEVKNKEEVPKYIIFSDNDALLIGKNGKNLKALSLVVSGYLNKELGRNYKFIIDVNEYKEKREQSLERLAKRIAREVGQTKIAAKLDPMNSYERRIIHNILTNNKKVYTESEGEEPNRYVVIKPKEEA